MSLRAGIVIGTLVVALLGGTACANPTYDAGSSRQELIAAGLTEQQAACVVQGMNERFGDRRLNAHALVHASERHDFVRILADCDVKAKSGADRSS